VFLFAWKGNSWVLLVGFSKGRFEEAYQFIQQPRGPRAWQDCHFALGWTRALH
jgi:hypothetical protein